MKNLFLSSQTQFFSSRFKVHQSNEDTQSHVENWRTQECEQHEHLGDLFPGMATGKTLAIRKEILAIRKEEHFPHESLSLKVNPQEKT